MVEFRLERRSNRAGRFILFVVNSVEAKIFSLYFPEGRSLATGWSVLAEKLRHLGVGSLSMASSSPLSVTPRIVDDEGTKEGTKGS